MRKWWLRKVFRVYVALWLMREFWGLAAWFKLPNLLIIWPWTHFLTSLNIIFFIHNIGNNNNNVHMHVKSLQSYLTLCYPRDHSLPSSCPWDSPGKNTGMGCHALLVIFPAQGSNPCLLCPWAGGFFTTSVTWEAH